jgi:WD repeat-containing protein 48
VKLISTSISSEYLTDNSISSTNKDYFSSPPVSTVEETQVPATPNVPTETPGSPEPAKESTFMGRLKSFGAKKLASKSEKDDAPHANGTDKDENSEKTDEELANGNGIPAKDTPYTFADVLAAIQKNYENALNATETTTVEKSDEASVSSISKIPVLEDGRLKSAMTPSMAEDTPVIHPSQDTIIIIAEQKVSVDGSMDLYRGTVASVGNDVDLLEDIAPGWLGELLLLVYPFNTLTD